MENEIELKIMLFPENIPLIIDWLNQQPIIQQGQDFLGNTYYDSADHYFANNKMGLRVRHKNQQYEMTLKTQGDIVGGLHIRPEYNLPLANSTVDFKQFVKHFQLDFDNAILNAELFPVFSTDFKRNKWLIEVNQSKIEVALDQGLIKNAFGEDVICEIEFELKQGQLADLFALLDQMPKENGMWFSSLSKAQRGYFVGKPVNFADFYPDLTHCNWENLSELEKYQITQQLADAIRLSGSLEMVKKYADLTQLAIKTTDFFISKTYLIQNIEKMKKLF